jgi:hypothetical protein
MEKDKKQGEVKNKEISKVKEDVKKLLSNINWDGFLKKP